MKKALFCLLLLIPTISSELLAQQPLTLIVLEQEPSPGNSATSPTPLIRVKFQDGAKLLKKESLLVEVDRTDVSSLVQIDGDSVFFQTQVPLIEGSHEVRITGTTSDGRKIQDLSWSFNVAAVQPTRSWMAGVEPTGTFEYKVREDTTTKVNRSRFNSNIAITSQITAPLQASFNSNLQAQGPHSGPSGPGTPRELDLANYQFTVSGPSTNLFLGDVNVNFDLLAVANLSRRGLFFQQKLPYYNSGFDVFSVRSESIFGFRHGLGISNSEQRVDGGSFFFAPTRKPENMTLRFYYLRGENAKEQGFNFGGVTRGSKGDAYGLILNSNWWANQIRSEIYTGWSDFDFDASDAFSGNRDRAFLTKLIYDPAPVTWRNRPSKLMVQLEVQNLGTFFKSLGNPFLQSDRIGLNLISNWNYGIFGTNVGIARFRDNVKDLNLIPTVDNVALSAGFTIVPTSPTGIPQWPMFSLTATRTHQDSRGEAVSFLALDNIANSISVTTQLVRTKWNLAITPSYGRNEDRNNRVPDTDIKSVSVSGFVTPYTFWTLGPSITFIRQGNSDTGIQTDQWTYSWTSSVPIQPERFTFDTQLSYSSTESSDELNINSNFSGTAQLSYHFHHLWKTPGKQTLSLRLSLNRNISDAPFINRIKGFEVFGAIDLGWPFR